MWCHWHHAQRTGFRYLNPEYHLGRSVSIERGTQISYKEYTHPFGYGAVQCRGHVKRNVKCNVKRNRHRGWSLA
jgi:hypothetical protein